jgi:3-dehydroquinate synthase
MKGSTAIYFDTPFSRVTELAPPDRSVVITDTTVHALHADKLKEYRTIVIPAGEANKQQHTVDYIIEQLIAYEADRRSSIIGLGGGVITDIAGYAAAIYMRGIPVGFVPTTILAQVDASVGGKNGVDVGLYKNLVGTIRQPAFILYDYSFLNTLPEEQWVNGFAEIIKHACIKDADLFEQLEQHELKDFREDSALLSALIERNVTIKSGVVAADEREQGERKLLNFGHTLGHAIENEYGLLHGHAISIGMAAATEISAKTNHFPTEEKERILRLLKRYQLPVNFDFDRGKAFNALKMDKKRVRTALDFILLNRIGEARIQSIPLEQLEQLIHSL